MHRTTAIGHVIIDGKRQARDRSDGPPVIPGTIDVAEHQNAIQEEICNVVEYAGIELPNTPTEDRAAGFHNMRDAIFLGQAVRETAIHPLTLSRLYGAGTTPPQASADDICLGFVESQWAAPDIAPNYVSAGEHIRDVCLGWDSSSQSFILYIATVSNEIKVLSGLWNFNSAPPLGTALTLTFPDTVDAICSMCYRNNRLYVAWGTLGGTIKISAFNVNPLTAIPAWTRDTTVGYYVGQEEYVKIIMGSGLYVAALLPDDANQGRIGVVTIGNSSYTLGNGNRTAQLRKAPDIVSDGTHVFFVGYNLVDTTATFQMLSARLSDPTTSDYLPVTIKSAALGNDYEYPTGMVRAGNKVFTSTGEGRVYYYDVEEETCFSPVLTDADTPFRPNITTDHFVISGHDGQNYIQYTLHRNGAFTDDAVVLRRYPVGSISGRITNVHYLRELPYSVFSLRGGLVSSYSAGRMLFDTRSIWLVTRSGDIFRIANTGA